MVLARAQLFEETDGTVAARDRTNAITGRGMYRDSEIFKMGGEAPVGSLSTKDMPKRQDAGNTTADAAAHGEQFQKWMQTSLVEKARTRF